MPITRRKRATPPEQPENNPASSAETTENTNAASTQSTNTPQETEQVAQPANNTALLQREESQPPTKTPPTQREESHSQPSSSVETQSPIQPSITHVTNGERPERRVVERSSNERPSSERSSSERQEAPIEGGRRTARGELFRRPPQVPPQAAQTTQATHAPTAAPPLPPPSHEISLPLGNLLHLSYNPGYTGADEARSQLLEQLTQESKKGGRARCWNCGSIAIKYDRWNTRSKTFGEVGVAICEICGVWSVM